jgi:hypothetical protein
MVWLSARKWCRANQAGIFKGVSVMIHLTTRRTWCLAILILPLALLVTGKSEKPKRVVWKGVETFELAYTYNGPFNVAAPINNEYKHKIVIHFTYIEETDPQGHNHFVSKKLSWNLEGESLGKGYESTSCKGGGEVELVGLSEHDQKERLKATCTRKEYAQNYFVFFLGPPGVIDPPKLVRWDQLRDNCSYSEESTKPSGEHHTYSVSVSAELDAVMEVKTEKLGNNGYWQFVPEPGKQIFFSARSNIPARFHFTLEDVSHFPGFATNAKIDSSFFKRYNLEQLEGKYGNYGPDLIFNSKDFEDLFSNWKPPDAKMLVVETAKDSYAASVPVTAMDFAAYGHLRAYAKSKCGGWQPVRIRVGGKDRDFVTIPMDENNNLIADRMEEPNNGITDWAYAGDPGSDDDKEPTGDNKLGDGFTLFEEYRGFMLSQGPLACWDQKPEEDPHLRTNPKKKDLFIYTSDPLLAFETNFFHLASGLEVHLICERHQQGPRGLTPEDNEQARIVNFTLQKDGPKNWNNKIISLHPQHALYLRNSKLEGGLEGQSPIGPPKNVDVVEVDKEKCLAAGQAAGGGQLQLRRVVTHELGHAVSIEHHGDRNIPTTDVTPPIKGPIVVVAVKGPIAGVDDVQSCPQDAVTGSVNGKTACMYNYIAIRNQQNSGEQTCPMKYIGWEWYVPFGSTLTPLNQEMEFKSGFLHLKSAMLPAYTLAAPTATGALKSYQQIIDTKWLGYVRKFCTSTTGTGINSGFQNHAGDAARGRGNCAAQIDVNDAN